jgi:septal ring factor EnvC (AmiA/AmiB activator)
MDIPKDIELDIKAYCDLNEITNINDFMTKLLKQGYTMEKYGATPQTIEKIIETEKIVEKIIEVPVDRIIEIPIERVVEKNVYISDDTKVSELTDSLSLIEQERDNLQNETNSLKEEIKALKNDIIELNNNINEITIKLETEQKKSKRDIYGEY